MNLQKYKLIYTKLSEHVFTLKELEIKSKYIYFDIVISILEGLKSNNESDRIRLLYSLQNTDDALITTSIDNLKLLIELSNSQYNKISRLKKLDLLYSQKKELIILQKKLDVIIVNFTNILISLINKLNLIEYLIEPNNYSKNEEEIIILNLHKEII